MTAGLVQRTISMIQYSCKGIYIEVILPIMSSIKGKVFGHNVFLLRVLVKQMKVAEHIAALFPFPVLWTNLVSLHPKSGVYCLISPDTSRTMPLLALAAVDPAVSHCSTKEARKMPLCENATQLITKRELKKIVVSLFGLEQIAFADYVTSSSFPAQQRMLTGKSKLQ